MSNFLKYIPCILFSILLIRCTISEDKHTEYEIDLVNRHKNEVKLSEFISKIKIVQFLLLCGRKTTKIIFILKLKNKHVNLKTKIT